MQFATCSAWKESSSKVQSSGTWLFQQCCSSWEHPAWWTSPCWARQRLQPYACDATSRHWKSSFLAGWLVPAPAIMKTLELAQSPAFSPSCLLRRQRSGIPSCGGCGRASAQRAAWPSGGPSSSGAPSAAPALPLPTPPANFAGFMGARVELYMYINIYIWYM